MKKDRLVPVLGILCILSVFTMVTVLRGSGADNFFTPPPFESGAVSGLPAVPEGLGFQQLDAGVFRVNLCGRIRVREGMAEVWFANPAGNSVWLKLRILDEDGNILGQTGLLRPGEYVRGVTVADLPAGTPVVLKVMAYEPDTYRSAGALTLHTCIAQ